MDESGLPRSVLEFISRHVHSVEQLEVLLLLRRHPDRSWTASAVSYELRISAVSASQRLEDLCSRALVECQAGSDAVYHYRPGSAELASGVAELEEAYSTRRVAVITAIFSRPPDPVRDFAEAFRVNRKKGDGRG